MVHLLTGWKDADEDYVVNVVVEPPVRGKVPPASHGTPPLAARVRTTRAHRALLHGPERSLSPAAASAAPRSCRPHDVASPPCPPSQVEHVTDADRENTAVMAAIGAVFCSGTRSPY